MSEGFGNTEISLLDTESVIGDVLSKHRFVLADFYAEWCGPCLTMLPSIQRINDTFTNVEVLKINVDDHLDLCETYRILGVPTVILFEMGIEIWRKIGVASYEQMVTALTEFSSDLK